MADDQEPQRVPDYGVGEPANTQEWIRRAFGPHLSEYERHERKLLARERKRDRRTLFSGETRRRWGGR